MILANRMTHKDMDNALAIHHLIEGHAEKSPNHVAIIDEDVSYTYSKLNHKANQLAHYLLDYVKDESVIAIAIPSSAALLIGILAILKAGCAYLPLDAKHPIDRLQFLLE